MGIRKMSVIVKNVTGKLLILLALMMSLTACSTQKDEVSSADHKDTTEATASKSDSELSAATTEKNSNADNENAAMIDEDNNQEESKLEADSSDATTKEAELTEESEENVTTPSDSDVSYKTFKLVNPDEVEYFGESPTFTISYDEDGIQISLDFAGSNTFAMYEPDDTSFSARPEVVSFSMGDDGMGDPSENNSTMELSVDGDKATIIFHTPEGEQSDPLSFERVN